MLVTELETVRELSKENYNVIKCFLTSKQLRKKTVEIRR